MDNRTERPTQVWFDQFIATLARMSGETEAYWHDKMGSTPTGRTRDGLKVTIKERLREESKRERER